jgi:hypothetical protein
VAVVVPPPSPAASELQPLAPAASTDALAMPVPAAPGALYIPVKPPAGQEVPLTGPTRSPGAILAAEANRTPPGASGLLDRVLAQGRPIDPRPGRADDFAWPRPR